MEASTWHLLSFIVASNFFHCHISNPDPPPIDVEDSFGYKPSPRSPGVFSMILLTSTTLRISQDFAFCFLLSMLIHTSMLFLRSSFPPVACSSRELHILCTISNLNRISTNWFLSSWRRRYCCSLFNRWCFPFPFLSHLSFSFTFAPLISLMVLFTSVSFFSLVSLNSTHVLVYGLTPNLA